ncbi:hypothetical protein ACMD2_02187 [Ananas comosus]|uniref:TOD1/MUCI70 glycosyltransferase-like domain-containing protein n=1 Tax=Ananas comosus TaxID=4615 RepID=A0A199VNT1_ANACO|nr:hypothetical protein ACMD2_02187 [Ananas comosus]
MSGGSVGLRSASYGSLQQMAHNNSNGSAAELPIPSPSPPLAARSKPSKTLLSGSREKERFLQWICKIVCRRKVGMLLLLAVSAAVLCSLFSILKDEDAPTAIETNLGFSTRVRSFVNPTRNSVRNSRPSLIPVETNRVNRKLPADQLPAATHNQIQRPPILPPIANFTRHPCENFSFPPPPPDRRRIGPRPCPVCYVSVEEAIARMPPLPSESPVLKKLNYVSDDTSVPTESNRGSEFGGYISLEQRSNYFDIVESMTVHCGFVKGKKPGQGTGFDIDADALFEMEQCHGVVVATAIFGNYDIMQQPKNISEYSQKEVCFYMFVDEETEAYIKNSSLLDGSNRAGLWRLILVRNLPFADPRRNGKVPKLLLQRLFPNARYSLWIDGKLELIVDPFQILERFLWRKKATFAISRHYRRFDVFEEAEANKAAGKYENASIDYQIEFYKSEGLTHYSPAKLPITSDVPEGCVIIREHTPITDLFTCLWFNEVDRFTSRDQLSFSTVRDKIRLKVNWTVDMFMDCERRNFVVQSYHKDLLEQRKASLSNQLPLAIRHELPPKVIQSIPADDGLSRSQPAKPPPPAKVPMRRGKRRHHPRATTGKDSSSV